MAYSRSTTKNTVVEKNKRCNGWYWVVPRLRGLPSKVEIQWLDKTVLLCAYFCIVERVSVDENTRGTRTPPQPKAHQKNEHRSYHISLSHRYRRLY